MIVRMTASATAKGLRSSAWIRCWVVSVMTPPFPAPHRYPQLKGKRVEPPMNADSPAFAEATADPPKLRPAAAAKEGRRGFAAEFNWSYRRLSACIGGFKDVGKGQRLEASPKISLRAFAQIL